MKNYNMDISQFDVVCNIDKMFCVCVCLYIGVTVGRAVMI